MVEVIHEPIIPGVELGDFESIKRVSDSGTEFWSARDLQVVAGYDKWERFEGAVDRAILSAENQGVSPSDHIASAGKMIETGKGAQREVRDYWITRYGCYLVFQNGDPRKPEIAAAQGYFAVRTREAEVQQATALPPAPATYADALRDLADKWESEQRAIERAEKAETIVDAVNSNRGLNCRKFHKHYFPDVPERAFFELLYSSGLLIDQRRSRWHEKKQEWVDGYEHMHPAYTGKPYFYLDGPVIAGKRRETTRVRPGQPEVELRNILIRKGLPAADIKELIA